jgi:hypothetical protein
MGVMKINELLNNITNTDFYFKVRGITVNSISLFISRLGINIVKKF